MTCNDNTIKKRANNNGKQSKKDKTLQFMKNLKDVSDANKSKGAGGGARVKGKNKSERAKGKGKENEKTKTKSSKSSASGDSVTGTDQDKSKKKKNVKTVTKKTEQPSRRIPLTRARAKRSLASAYDDFDGVVPKGVDEKAAKNRHIG